MMGDPGESSSESDSHILDDDIDDDDDDDDYLEEQIINGSTLNSTNCLFIPMFIACTVGFACTASALYFNVTDYNSVQHAHRPPDVAVRETFEWRLPDLDDDQTADSPEDKEVRDAMKRFWKLEHAKMAQGKEKGSSYRAVKEEEEENRLTSGFQCGDVTAYKSSFKRVIGSTVAVLIAFACIAFTAMYSCVLALHWKRDVNHWRNFAEQSRSITGMMTPVAQLSAPSGGLNSLSLSVATDFPYHQQYHVRYNPTPEVTLHNETADPGFIHHQHDEMAAASEVQRRSRSPTTLPSMSHSFYSSQNEIKGNNL